VTNEREPQPGAWEADDAEDNELTTVARNPLLSPPPGALAEASAQDGGERPSGRPSLYERLVAKGELAGDSEEEAALAALGPVDDGAREDEVITEESAVKPSAASLSQPTRGFPRPPSEFELAYLRASSTPPGEPARGSEPSRASTIPLRDSEIEMVRRDSDGFITALAHDPDVDEPPVSARFRRPPELPSAPTPPQLPVPLPSVMLSPQMSTRHDSTERISTGLPSTHALANSVAPTSIPDRRREDRRSSGLLFAAVAAALVAGGVAIFSGQSSREPEQRVAVSAQPAREPVVQAAPEQIAEATAPVPAQPVAPEPTAEDLARERRHRLRAEREAAARATSGEGPAAAEPATGDKPAAEVAPVAVEPGPAQPAVAEPKAKAAEGALPTQPTRDQVVAAMNTVLPALQECVGDKHGVADVTVTVRSAGFVSYAIVGGTFVGTPEGSCIAKVVRDAKFPEFADPFIRVTYPFNL
jgi:hypothetical protein